MNLYFLWFREFCFVDMLFFFLLFVVLIVFESFLCINLFVLLGWNLENLWWGIVGNFWNIFKLLFFIGLKNEIFGLFLILVDINLYKLFSLVIFLFILFLKLMNFCSFLLFVICKF